MFFIDYIDGKRIVKSDLINEVVNFFTTRDICIHSKNEDVSYNKKIVEEYLGQKLAVNKPIHGVDIAEVVENKFLYENVDGLILKKGIAGHLYFADCVPLIFYCNGVAMISHAGWRGTAKQIAKVSVNKLVKNYGCKKEDIKVVIGPAICFDCYEVGKEVYDVLLETVDNKNGLFLEKGNKYFVDLKGINKQQLLECNVNKIDVCPYCTNCGEKLFYSYRYEKQIGHRHSAVVKV